MTEIDDIIAQVSKYYASRKKKKDKGVDITIPSREHNIVYDSTSETLEPIYFWILDFMNDMFRGKVEKLADNFASSPGSGHFSELQGKASQMQQEASRVLGTVNAILKGIINLIYDLREFEIRLSHYEAAESKDKEIKEAGMLALKQMWMDKVDIQRGQGSINAMTSGNLNFVTLRDAFLSAKSVEDVDRMDLNDRVKRILKPRLQEFFEWKKRSYEELKKRFEIEKSYLKSQVAALKINTRWARPYLRAAQQLTAAERLGTSPALVTVFNTILLELSIMGKKELKVEEAVISKDLPRVFKNLKRLRKYYSIVIVDFNFRGIPSKVGQHYAFGGRAEVTFKAYSLNEDELDLFTDKYNKSDLNDALALIEGMTSESLSQIAADLEKYIGKEEEKEEKKSKDTNPFTALFDFNFSLFPTPKSKEEKLKVLKEKGPKIESYAEKYIRNLAEANAISNCFSVYDIYKKAHGMASFPYGGKPEGAEAPRTEAEKFFGLGRVGRGFPEYSVEP